MRAQVGDAAQWTVAEHLAANMVDLLNVANWQRSAKKGSRPPKPIPRPGDAAPKRVRPGRSYTVDELEQIKARVAERGGD